MRSGRAVLAAFALFLAGVAGGCFARTYRARPGPYDILPDEIRPELVQARAAWDAGDLEACRALLASITRRFPRCLPVAVFKQEVELELLEQGQPVEGVSAPGKEEALLALGELYRARADSDSTPAGEVLAARLESDSERALARLARAVELDPDCVWAHYAIAYWNARLRRFPQARSELKASLRLDGGHLPSMRLQAWLLANAGSTEEARDCLERWLERTEEDPLTPRAQRAEAQVDLAALAVLSGDPGEALSLLEGADRDALREPARAELVRCAALEDSGEPERAMAAARRAHDLDPDELLGLVQQALLLEKQGNEAQERAAWQWVLDELERRRTARARPADESTVSLDLSEVLIQLQASTRVERLDRARPSQP
jgi:tetratricopeptide (TPR) repeat protein